MNRWLAEPVTRAEAIGWALTFPAVWFIALAGLPVVSSLSGIDTLAQHYPDLTPGYLDICLRMGTGGLLGVFGFCALVSLGAQLSRQRSFVRIAAPLIGILLAYSASQQYWASVGEFSKFVKVLHGTQAVEGLPR